MEKQIAELLKELPNEHKNLATYCHHLNEQLEKEKSDHFKLTALEAMNGGSPKGLTEQAFFRALNNCKKIIIDELKKANQHLDEVEEKYEQTLNIERIQFIKEKLPNKNKDIAIFAQELIKRFVDEKEAHLQDIGRRFLHNQTIEREVEKVYFDVVNRIEESIMNHLEKTTEDIINQYNPGYLRNYQDGVSPPSL